MKTIKQYIAEREEKRRLLDEANLRYYFKVAERGGFIWLTYGGVAFAKVANEASAEDIAAMLNESRDCAVEFERL